MREDRGDVGLGERAELDPGDVRPPRQTGHHLAEQGRAAGQRQGSFADTDRVVIVTYKGDAERARITGLRGARRLLRRAALDDDAVDRAVGELHQGHAILLVDLREIAASEADAQLEKLARAA